VLIRSISISWRISN